MTGFRLEEILMLFLLVVAVFFLKAGKFWDILIPSRALLLLAFSLIIITSISVGSFLGLPASILDLSKFIWLFKSIVVYIIFYNYVYCSESRVIERRDNILKMFVNLGVIASILCFQQYFDWFSLNQYYIEMVAPTQYETLMPGYRFPPRVVGMMGNPNVQGFILCLSLISFTYLYLKNSDSVRWVSFLCLFVAMAMTLSRTSLIVFFAGTIVLFMLYTKNRLFALYKLFLFVFICALLTGFYLLFKDNELVYTMVIKRFELLQNGVNDVSFNSRFHQWMLNVEYFKMSPIFGVGPLPRANIFGAADNEWLLLIRCYGIVGICWLMVFFFYPLLISRTTSVAFKNYKVFILSIIAASALYMVPAGIITSPHMFPFLLILLATLDHNVLIVGAKKTPDVQYAS